MVTNEVLVYSHARVKTKSTFPFYDSMLKPHHNTKVTLKTIIAKYHKVRDALVMVESWKVEYYTCKKIPKKPHKFMFNTCIIKIRTL